MRPTPAEHIGLQPFACASKARLSRPTGSGLRSLERVLLIFDEVIAFRVAGHTGDATAGLLAFKQIAVRASQGERGDRSPGSQYGHHKTPDHGHHGSGLDEIKREANARDGICLFEKQVGDALTNPRNEYH